MTETTQPARHRREWTSHEDDQLHMLWGEMALAQIAKTLQRTPWGVSARATILELGCPSRATWSVQQVADHSGFNAGKVRRAIAKMRLKVRRALNSTPGCGDRSNELALTDEQADAVTEYMLKHPYVWTDAPGMSRSTKGMWGVGKKPATCVKCHRADRPHMARGECRACYTNKIRRARPPSLNKSSRPTLDNPILDAEKVLQIRERRHAGETLDALGAAFSVTRQAIAAIVKGRTWKHVSGPTKPVAT